MLGIFWHYGIFHLVRSCSFLRQHFVCFVLQALGWCWGFVILCTIVSIMAEVPTTFSCGSFYLRRNAAIVFVCWSSWLTATFFNLSCWQMSGVCHEVDRNGNSRIDSRILSWPSKSSQVGCILFEIASLITVDALGCRRKKFLFWFISYLRNCGS